MKVNTFGELLTHYRVSHKISQSKLGKRAGLDRSYICKLENGSRVPSRDTVDKLGEALQLSPEQRNNLLAAAGFLPPEPIYYFRNLNLKRLDELLPTCNREVQEDVLETLRMALRVVTAASATASEARL